MNEAHFALNHQYKWEENRPIEFNYNLAVKYKQTDKVIGVIVSVSSDREEQPFRFSVTWEGLFVFDVVPSKDVLDRVAQINCASIIYPYLRESVTDLTRRASLPPLNLPPVNFVARYEEEHKPEAKKPSSQKTRRKSRE
jgi:preprotein translocase subunit SecB